MHQFAAPGEILQEFEAERRRVGAEEERRRLDEERASAQLLAQAEAEAAQLVRLFLLLAKFPFGTISPIIKKLYLFMFEMLALLSCTAYS